MIQGIPVRQVPLVGGQAPSGALLQQGVLEFVDDATVGLYIRKLTVGSMVARFQATPLIRICVWNVAAHGGTLLQGPNDITITMATEETSGIITLTAVPINYTNITVTVTINPTAEGVAFSGSMTNTNPSYGVEYVDYPCLACLPHSGNLANAYLAHGWLGGFTLKDSHTAAQAVIGSPPSMQCWDYFDIDNRVHLYASTNDDVGYNKEWIFEGVTTGTCQRWRHHFKNPRLASNSGFSTQHITYVVDVALFIGKTGDGRCGHYDTAIRYRDWAANPLRPWMSRGKWVDATSGTAKVPARVRDSDFYILYATTNSAPPSATFWTTAVEDVRRLKNAIGADECIMLWYGWSVNQTGLLAPPSFRPQAFAWAQPSDESTAIGTATANGIHVSIYTIPGVWDTTLNTSDFKFTDFQGTIAYDLSQYVVKSEAGTVLTSNSLAAFDLGNALTTVEAVLLDVYRYDGSGVGSLANGYYWGTSNKIHGYYMDLWGGGGVLLNYDPTVNPNGNTGLFAGGKSACTQYLREQMRILDPEFFLSTENVEEQMIPTIDIAHIYDGLPAAGHLNGMFGIVHSRFVPIYDLSITFNSESLLNGIPSSYYLFYMSWVMWQWHQTGGHLCLHNGTGVPICPVDPPSLFNTPQFPLIAMMNRVISRMNTNEAIRNYMRTGFRCRPLPSSIEGDFIASGQSIIVFLTANTSNLNPASEIFSSVWRDLDSPNFPIGIVLTSIYTGNMTVDIHVEPEAYDFNPQEPYILYRNIDGVRTELTRFIGTLDYTHTLVFDGAGPAVDLLEIIKVNQITESLMVVIDEPDPGDSVVAGTTLTISWHTET